MAEFQIPDWYFKPSHERCLWERNAALLWRYKPQLRRLLNYERRVMALWRKYGAEVMAQIEQEARERLLADVRQMKLPL